jgi:repressor LexA
VSWESSLAANLEGRHSEIVNETVGYLIKQLRLQRGLTQAQLARAAGYASESTISEIESGKAGVNPDTLARIADALGVELEDLLPRVRSKRKPKASGSETTRVPVVGAVHAGQPALAAENVESWIEISSDLLPKSGDYFALRVKGDCMSFGPNAIHDGDLVVVRRQSHADNGSIVVALWPGQEEAQVRRLHRAKGRVLLVASNPSYPPAVFGPRDVDLSILGKVVLVTRQIP